MAKNKIKKYFLSLVIFIVCFFVAKEALLAREIFRNNDKNINLTINGLTINNTNLNTELPVSAQPISDYSKLYDVFVKSEYETQAQYESRIKDFLAKEPLHFFDLLLFKSEYNAETQTLSFKGGRTVAGNNFTSYNLPSSSLYFDTVYGDAYGKLITNNHNIIIINSDTFGITYDEDSYNYDLFAINLNPNVAQSIRDNLEIRVGLHVLYRSEGVAFDEFHCFDLTDIDSCYSDYYLIGELSIITLYDDNNNTIYYQNEKVDPSWLPTTTTSILPTITTTLIFPQKSRHSVKLLQPAVQSQSAICS